MPQARSNIPTVAERLEKPQQLNSTVRAYSYSEYVEKRPDFIGFDKYGAGAGWGNLAKALDGFYNAFNRQSNDVFLPQWKERGEALGQEQFNAHSELDGYTKNRLAFKEFVEKHPEMANKNPWVRVGYENARLNTLALEMENGLEESMIKNGLYSEEDETKVQQYVQNYIKSFKDEAGLTEYHDSVLLAKAFGSKEAQIGDGAMDRYRRIQESERQNKLANAVHDQMVAILTSGNMTEAQKNAALEAALNQGRENGLLDSRAEAVVPEVLKAAYAITKNEGLLKRAEHLEINGRKLIQYKGVPEWISAETTRIAQKQAAAAQKAAIAHDRFMRNELAKGAMYIGMGFESGQFTDLDTAIQSWQEKSGVKLSPEDLYTLRHKASLEIGRIRQDQYNQASTPDNVIATQKEITDIRMTSETRGEETQRMEELYRKTKSPLAKDAWIKSTNDAIKDGLNADKHEAKVTKEVSTYFSTVAKSIVKTAEDTFKSEDLVAGRKNSYDSFKASEELKTKMMSVYTDKMTAYVQEFEAKNPGQPMTNGDFDALSEKALEETKAIVDNGAFRDDLTRERLMLPAFGAASQAQKEPQFYAGLDPQKVIAAENWRKATDTYLKSKANSTSYKSISALEAICDTKKMFADGVQAIDLATLIKYAKPNTTYHGKKMTKDGTVVVPYQGDKTDFTIQSIKMDFPDVAIANDASMRVKSLMTSSMTTSSKDREIISDVLKKDYNIKGDTVLDNARTVSVLVSALKNKKWSDEDIVKFWMKVEQASQQQRRKNNSRKR